MKENYRQYRPLFESFISLYLLNGLNLLLPLVSIPYLFRVVGASNYGIYAYVYVIIQYVLLVSNYGFDFSATKQIAQVQKDIEIISNIYHSVLLTRLLLSIVVSALLFVFTSFLFDDIQNRLLLLGLGVVIGEVFVPVWLFQGMEKMRYITITSFISKLIFTALIFVLIKEKDDFPYIIFLNSLGSIVSGIISSIIVYKILNIKFRWPTLKDVVFQLKEGFAVFVSTLGINLYRNSNVFILGLFVSDASVGVYVAAEKVIKAIQGVVNPIAQALFPHVSSQLKHLSAREGIHLLMRIVKKVSFLLLFLSVVTCLFSPFIAKIMGGDEFMRAIPLIRIFSLVIFFGGLNYLLGIVGLINFNRQRNFMSSVWISGIFSVVFLLLTVQCWDNMAAVIAMVMSEVLLFVGCCISLYRVYYSQ